MNSEKGWILEVKDDIWKKAARFPIKDRKRISEVIEKLPDNPYAGDIEKMKGEENVWRRRIGNYRIFYEVVSDRYSIYVFKIERRVSKTY